MDRGKGMTDLAAGGGEVLPTVVQSFWKEFDLEGLRSRLDEQGLAVATAQEASVRSRKALAERTKEFRRRAAQEVSREVAPLLKAYQEEVDRLTSRSKSAEAAFLDLYQKLYEAPDPAPALAAGLELASRSTQLEAEAAKMAQELAEYKSESQELKNQDFTIRKLEERVRELEAQLTERDRQLAEQQKSAEAEMQERLVAEMKEREAALSDELAQAQANLDLLRRLHQASQNQLFSLQSKNEEEAAGMQSELELATAEMERSQQRLAMLEQEKAALLARLQQQQAAQQQAAGQQAAGQQAAGEGWDDEGLEGLTPVGAAVAGAGGLAGSGGSKAAEESLRQELYAQRELATRLQSEVAALRQQLEAEAATWASRCEGLRGSLAAQEAHAAALEQELGSRPTQQQVEELRQQVRILQAVSGYGADDEQGEGGAAARGAAGGGAASGEQAAPGAAGAVPAGRALEAALVSKSRQLEHKLTMLRLELAEAKGEAESAAGRAAELEAELAQQKELVSRLEEDLLAAENAAAAAAGAVAGGAGSSGAAGGAAGAGGGGSGVAGLPGAAAGADGDAGDHTMVAVLCSQRDRFRARAQELESHLATLGQELKKVRADAEAMRADNLALAERLKFVQGYQADGSRRAAAAAEAGVASSDVEAGAVVGKYMQQYEQSINPFADFKAKEREARRKQLPLQDKAMYAVGQLISGNSLARSAIFFYALLLHAVIFFILARTSHHHAEHLELIEEECLRLQHSHLAAGGAAAAADAAAAAAGGGAAAAGVAGGGLIGSSSSDLQASNLASKGGSAGNAGGAAAGAVVEAAAGLAGEAVQQGAAALLRLLRRR